MMPKSETFLMDDVLQGALSPALMQFPLVALAA